MINQVGYERKRPLQSLKLGSLPNYILQQPLVFEVPWRACSLCLLTESCWHKSCGHPEAGYSAGIWKVWSLTPLSPVCDPRWLCNALSWLGDLTWLEMCCLGRTTTHETCHAFPQCYLQLAKLFV